MIQLLADHGAKLDVRDKAGLTPLDMANGKRAPWHGSPRARRTHRPVAPSDRSSAAVDRPACAGPRPDARGSGPRSSPRRHKLIHDQAALDNRVGMRRGRHRTQTPAPAEYHAMLTPSIAVTCHNEEAGENPRRRPAVSR